MHVLRESELKDFRTPVVPTGLWILVAALVVEVLLFSALAENFFTAGNFFEVLRFSVELGLLAIALTPVIITGGIDLSVGSTMGLAAIVFGLVWRDWNAPLAVAAAAALFVGCAGGGLNAFLISRLQLPPLIVTLGSFSMFRGIAEGLTRAAVNYTDFPKSFLLLGQGYLGGVVPAQLPIFFLIFGAYAILLHRSTIGRAWYAIGSNAAGARYAGIPVAKRVALAYVLSGLIASVAAIIYVAHLGQARSDAGTGYELDAITAVVLGGTSVFGGRGNLWGTLVALLSLSVLQNGLHLAALPSELTGVLTGTILLCVIGLEKWGTRGRPLVPCVGGGGSSEEQPGRNSVRCHSGGRNHRRRHERLACAFAGTRCRWRHCIRLKGGAPTCHCGHAQSQR
jgi:rhamnose transport system permease protein